MPTKLRRPTTPAPHFWKALAERILAWVARREYAYATSSNDPMFCEFQWTGFLRTHLVLGQLLDRTKDWISVTLADLEREDAEAMAAVRRKLLYPARAPEARASTGYLG